MPSAQKFAVIESMESLIGNQITGMKLLSSVTKHGPFSMVSSALKLIRRY